MQPRSSRGWSREPLAPEVALVEAVRLDHRAHRAVEDEDPLAKQRRQARQASLPALGAETLGTGHGGRSVLCSARMTGGQRESTPILLAPPEMTIS